jgi:hypothetical protein
MPTMTSGCQRVPLYRTLPAAAERLLRLDGSRPLSELVADVCAALV